MHMQGYARIGRSKKLQKEKKEQIAEIAYPASPSREEWKKEGKKIETRWQDGLLWEPVCCVCVVCVSSKLV